MAVKAAVVGYEELNKVAEGGDEVEEEIGDEELDELEKKDLEGLLLMDAGDVMGVEEEEGGVCESPHANNANVPSIPDRRVHSRRILRFLGESARFCHRLDGTGWYSWQRIERRIEGDRI